MAQLLHLTHLPELQELGLKGNSFGRLGVLTRKKYIQNVTRTHVHDNSAFNHPLAAAGQSTVFQYVVKHFPESLTVRGWIGEV